MKPKIEVTAQRFAKLVRNCAEMSSRELCELCPFILMAEVDDCDGIEHITDVQIVGSESDG